MLREFWNRVRGDATYGFLAAESFYWAAACHDEGMQPLAYVIPATVGVLSLANLRESFSSVKTAPSAIIGTTTALMLTLGAHEYDKLLPLVQDPLQPNIAYAASP